MSWLVVFASSVLPIALLFILLAMDWLQPVATGTLQLKNRIVMAPMTRNRASHDGVHPEYTAT